MYVDKCIDKNTLKGTKVYFSGSIEWIPNGYADCIPYIKKWQVCTIEEIIPKKFRYDVVLKECPDIVFPGGISLFRQVNKDMLHHLKKRGKTATCKGMYFRGYSSMYCHEGTIGRKDGFRFLKRKSCTDKYCDICSYRWEIDFTEGLDYEYGYIMFPDKIEHGALYSIRVTNISTDYETGIVDGYDLEFYKVIEELCTEENFERMKTLDMWKNFKFKED